MRYQLHLLRRTTAFLADPLSPTSDILFIRQEFLARFRPYYRRKGESLSHVRRRYDQSASGCFGRKLVVRCLLVTTMQSTWNSTRSHAGVDADSLTNTHGAVLAATGFQLSACAHSRILAVAY
ncbi:hypothetical protein AB1N83_009209 [Pleurotus pulmonarius]